jgi:hypothetical protein
MFFFFLNGQNLDDILNAEKTVPDIYGFIKEEERKVLLEDLFYISTGIVDDGSLLLLSGDENNKKEVRILRMAAFDPVHKKLKDTKDIDLADKKIERLRVNKSGESKVKKIHPDKTLKPIDYLINTRGTKTEPISGYSLYDETALSAENEIGTNHISPAVASHHFIILRPRASVLPHYHVPYLHLLLDCLLEKELPDLIEKKLKGRLNKKALQLIEVSVPAKKEDQEEIYNQFKKRVQLIRRSEEELGNMKLNLSLHMKGRLYRIK